VQQLPSLFAYKTSPPIIQQKHQVNRYKLITTTSQKGGIYSLRNIKHRSSTINPYAQLYDAESSGRAFTMAERYATLKVGDRKITTAKLVEVVSTKSEV
jgi:hypothetical protein